MIGAWLIAVPPRPEYRACAGCIARPKMTISLRMVGMYGSAGGYGAKKNVAHALVLVLRAAPVGGTFLGRQRINGEAN